MQRRMASLSGAAVVLGGLIALALTPPAAWSVLATTSPAPALSTAERPAPAQSAAERAAAATRPLRATEFVAPRGARFTIAPRMSQWLALRIDGRRLGLDRSVWDTSATALNRDALGEAIKKEPDRFGGRPFDDQFRAAHLKAILLSSPASLALTRLALDLRATPLGEARSFEHVEKIDGNVLTLQESSDHSIVRIELREHDYPYRQLIITEVAGGATTIESREPGDLWWSLRQRPDGSVTLLAMGRRIVNGRFIEEAPSLAAWTTGASNLPAAVADELAGWGLALPRVESMRAALALAATRPANAGAPLAMPDLTDGGQFGQFTEELRGLAGVKLGPRGFEFDADVWGRHLDLLPPPEAQALRQRDLMPANALSREPLAVDLNGAISRLELATDKRGIGVNGGGGSRLVGGQSINGQFENNRLLARVGYQPEEQTGAIALAERYINGGPAATTMPVRDVEFKQEPAVVHFTVSERRSGSFLIYEQSSKQVMLIDTSVAPATNVTAASLGALYRTAPSAVERLLAVFRAVGFDTPPKFDDPSVTAAAKESLRGPQKEDADRARELLAQLDGENFDRRLAAAAALREHLNRYEPTLRAARAAGNLSPEQAQAIERMLNEYDDAASPHAARLVVDTFALTTNPDYLRRLRATGRDTDTAAIDRALDRLAHPDTRPASP